MAKGRRGAGDEPGGRRKRGGARDRMRLCSACSNGKIEAVRKQLAGGVDADGPDELRGMPLVFATMGGHVEVVRLLLDAGADPEIATFEGDTPLFAAKRCNQEIYRLLRARGARKTGEADRARAEAEQRLSYERRLADFWATPVERRRGRPPWIHDHQYFEHLLVRAPVPEIRRALLAYEHTRPAPADAAHDQAADNSPVRTRQYRRTRLAVPQPAGLRLTFARPRGCDWTQVRGGHRLGGDRPFSNESLARYQSSALATKALIHGF